MPTEHDHADPDAPWDEAQVLATVRAHRYQHRDDPVMDHMSCLADLTARWMRHALPDLDDRTRGRATLVLSSLLSTGELQHVMAHRPKALANIIAMAADDLITEADAADMAQTSG